MDMKLVKDWGKVNAPFITNEDLLIKLYKAKVLKEKPVIKSRMQGSYTEIASLEENVPSIIIAMVQHEIRDTIFKSCAVCNKKVCNDPDHGGKMVTKDAKAIQLVDNTDSIPAFLVVDEDQMDVFRNYDIFIFSGVKVKEDSRFGGGYQFMVRKYIPLKSSEVSVVMDIINFIILKGVDGAVPAQDYYRFVAGLDKNAVDKAEEAFIRGKDANTVWVK